MIPGVVRPCLDCGSLTPDGDRCVEHRRAARRMKDRAAYAKHGRRQRRDGHNDAAWVRLSKRARALQPFCTVCGVTAEGAAALGDRLETDHKPSAWAKREQGERITLADVQVLCGTHNRALGSSRPGSARYAAWQQREQVAA